MSKNLNAWKEEPKDLLNGPNRTVIADKWIIGALWGLERKRYGGSKEGDDTHGGCAI
jgi:hypothetical protein